MKIKPTVRQELAFKKMLEKMEKKEPAVLKKIMVEAGYSVNSAINPEKNLTSKPGWEVLKRQLDDSGALQALNDLVSRENDDKRTRLNSAVEIIKILDGYPKQENKVIGLFEKIGNDFNRTTEEN